MTKVFTDWRGNEIAVGSHVIYSTAQSSIITVTEAVVEQINWDRESARFPISVYCRTVAEHSESSGYTGRRVTIKATERLVAVPQKVYPPGKSFDEKSSAMLEELNQVLEAHDDVLALA